MSYIASTLHHTFISTVLYHLGKFVTITTLQTKSDHLIQVTITSITVYTVNNASHTVHYDLINIVQMQIR